LSGLYGNHKITLQKQKEYKMDYRVMYMTSKGYEKLSKRMDLHEAKKFANKKNEYCEILHIEDFGTNF
tara:strand:- start:536 stop:739 length:204 start_codon:yes stop_codon:yes gene_type:complete